jgi:SNF2 family DNA or RNA helicase
LTGATRDRQRVVDAFEEGQAEVFLISLKAGGTGLNLVSADTVVHYDPWWNPAAQAQATDRAYRIGQKRPVFVHNLYVAGSVEERVLALQQKKRWLSNALLGDAGPAAPISEGEIDALFAPLEG